MQIKIVQKVIQVRKGDRAPRTEPQSTYKVFLNDVELAEFTGYNSMWESYSKAEPEMAAFVSRLKVALPEAVCNETTDQEYYKAARAAALAKLTPEERKRLNV